MNLNKVFILGNLTRDPETRTLPSGQPVTSFGIATNRFFTDSAGTKQKQTEFHNIVTFGKLAETASKYLQKGSLVLIEGRIQTRNWEGQDGSKRFRTEIIAESLQLGPKGFKSTEYQKKEEGPEEKGPKNINLSGDQEIPIIENSNPPTTQNKKGSSNPEEEIDVSQIPF